jgi:hypothetical protein
VQVNQNKTLRFAITAGALLVVFLHVWKPDLQIDSVTLALLIVAILPWAQPLIKSVELMGVRLELQELKNELAETKGAAASAVRKADYLLAGPSPAPTAGVAPAQPIDSAIEALQKLMAEYEHIRDTQSSGAARTQAMTAVVRKMIELAPALPGFDVATALSSSRRGERLAAYAYLFAQPDLKLLALLVTSVTKIEDKPFGQYWGLQAISRVLATRGREPLPASVLNDLSQFAERLPRGSDREYELNRILTDLKL